MTFEFFGTRQRSTSPQQSAMRELSATLPLSDYGRVARHSLTIQDSRAFGRPVLNFLREEPCRKTTLNRPGSIRQVVPLPRDELSFHTGTHHAKRSGSPDGEPCRRRVQNLRFSATRTNKPAFWRCAGRTSWKFHHY